jgi:hypothetical protein
MPRLFGTQTKHGPPACEEPSRFSAYTGALEQEQSAARSYETFAENLAHRLG